jgi:hypothetical protein
MKRFIITAAVLALAFTPAFAKGKKIDEDSPSYTRATLSSAVAAHLIVCDAAPSSDIIVKIGQWKEGIDYSDAEITRASNAQTALYKALGKTKYCQLSDGLIDRIQSVLDAHK